MQLLYFITTVISQVHSARHHQCAGTVLDRASSLLVNGFSVTSFRTFSKTLTFIIVVGGIGGRGGIKMVSAKTQ